MGILSAYLGLKHKVQQAEERYLKLKAQCEYSASQVTGQPRVANRNSRQARLAELIDSKKEFDALQDIYFDVEWEFENILWRELDDEEMVKVMAYRYILGEKFLSIAQYMQISEAKVYSLHRQAIEILLD